MLRSGRVFMRAGLPLAAMLAAAAPPLAVVAAPAEVVLDIPGGPLARALQAFAAQTHQQLLYSSAVTDGQVAAPLKGRFGVEQALQRLLQGSGIAVERTGPDTLVLKRRRLGLADAPAAAAGRTIPGGAGAAGSGVSGAGAAGSGGDGVVLGGPGALEARLADPEPIDQVVVTGTHIRGVSAGASPLVVIDRGQMAREGDATVSDALARLPQNFGGTPGVVTSLSGADRTGANTTVAQSVNLRGLGANATLVLIDGRRMAGTGSFGDFADVSALPSAAVDHVDVLLDGASAIYGSDAVGGVINVVTRKNFEGADSTLRFGVDEGGGGAAVQTTHALGLSWGGGHALLTVDYQHIDRLSASSRRYDANSDLTALGGTNHDTVESSPGNILGLNAAGTGYVALYAISGGSAVGLTPASFVAGTANLQNTKHDADIAPQSDQTGFYADVRQDLDPRTTLDVTARYSLRHYLWRESASETIAEVTPANPYYVSPNGAPYALIGLSADQIAGPELNAGSEQNYSLTLGLTRDLGADWRLDGYAGLAGDVGREQSRGVFNSSHLSQALGTTPAAPGSGFSTAADGFFNPYGDGLSNSAALRAFVTDGYSDAKNVNLIDVASLQVDGALFSLPGGTVKAAFGAQVRHEHFEPSTYTVISSAPFQSGGAVFSRDVAAAFGELNLPVVGAANAVPGIARLDLSVAGRVEHYDDVGTTANPKLGAVWRPVDEVAVRLTYGTSFRAPSLSELNQATLYAPDPITNAGKTTLVLLQYGGNPALKPETAVTWTAGVDWTPARIPGLRLGATWFDVDYRNEISDPGVLYLSTVLTDPGLASVVRRITPGNAADQAAIAAALAKAVGTTAALYPASAYGAIVDARYLNTASKTVSGLDLNAVYSRPVAGGRITVRGDATYLSSFSQIQAAGGPSESLLNTPNNPVDLKARAGVEWSRGAWTAAAFANYVDRYKDPVAHRSIPAWTTLDLDLGWAAPGASGPLHGLVVSAHVQNLLGTDPPFYDSPVAVGYDAANANPYGRVVSVQLNKRW